MGKTSSKKRTAIIVVAVVAVLIVVLAAIMTNSTKTIQRDGYSFECPSTWQFTDKGNGQIYADLGNNTGVSVIDYQTQGALTKDELDSVFFSDESYSGVTTTYSDTGYFTVGQYVWERGKAHVEGNGTSFDQDEAVGSVSDDTYVMVSARGVDSKDVDDLLQSIKLD